LLTHLLFDLIKKQPQARIINVSSLVHSGSPDNMLEDLACKTSSFG
jgi:NAD(P)-dependent dehydrogenase (short-subunit alcohol dehydrogenase family)